MLLIKEKNGGLILSTGSAVHTTTSTCRLVTYLSPWGDNNRFVLQATVDAMA